MGLMSAKTAGEKRDVTQRCASACAEGRTPAGHTFGVSDGAKKPGDTSAAQIGVPEVGRRQGTAADGNREVLPFR